MNNRFITATALALALPALLYSQNKTSSFSVIPLGVKGGSDESNLSSYMAAATGSDAFVCLDAGTVNYGLQKAVENRVLTGEPAAILRKNIKAFLISHPHLDHLAGMVINSPDDTSKNIYAMDFTIAALQDKYFSWKSWANFADEGEKPALGKYHYKPLTEGEKTSIEHTPYSVTAFTLSHGEPFKSTAFLLEYHDAYLLYLGDTGADTIEHAQRLRHLWENVAPLVKSKKLKAIFIETSFPNSQPDKSLFGHLTPKLLMHELHNLAAIAGEKTLSGLPVVITHEKPGKDNAERTIQQQLQAANTLQVKLVFPVQGRILQF